MAEVFTKYTIDTSQAVTALEGMKREVRELQGAEGSAQQKFQTNAQKRDAIYKEEGMSLKELRKQRDLLAQKSILSTDELQKLKQYNSQIDKAEANLKSLEKQKDKVGKTNKTLAGSFQKIGLAIGAAFGIREILNFTKQAAKLSAEAEGIRTAFVRVGGTQKILQDLEKATRGTVEQVELMRQSVRASNFKIPLEQLATFFEFATNRAIETGESVDYLVNSIIDGIGRKSTLVMDNLGISATELQEEVRKVGDFGEASANIIARELGIAGDVVETSATRTERSQARMKNAMIEFGQVVTPILTRFNELLANAMETLTRFVGFLGSSNEEAAKSTVELYTEQRQALLTAQSLQREYDILSQKTDLTAIEKNRLKEVTFELTQEFGDSVTEINKETGALEINRGALIKQIQMRAALQSEQATQLLADRQSAQVMIEQAKIARNLLGQMEGEVTDVRLRGLISSFLMGEDPSKRMKEVEELRFQLQGVAKQDLEQILRLGNQVVGGEGFFGTGRMEQIDQALEAMGLSLDDLADQLIGTGAGLRGAAGDAETLLEQLEKMNGIKPTDGMEEWAAFMDSLGRFTDSTEGLEEFTAFIDGMEGEEEKIMALRDAIASLGEGSPALKAALQGQLDELIGNAESQKETLLDSYVRTEEELAEKSLEVAAQLAEQLLRLGIITKEQYQAIIEGIKQQLDDLGDDTEDKVANAIASYSSLGAGIVGVFRDIYNATATDAQKNAAFLQQLTTFQILLEQASALASAISAASKGSITVVDLAIKIATAVGAVIAAFAQAKAIQNQAQMPARPSFGYGGEIQGKPHTQGGVHIEAERGEYIVKSSAYAKAKEAVHAINSERFDTYVTKHYIEPLLKSKRLAREDHDRGFARNIAESLHLDGKAEHYLKQIARKGNGARIENWDELARLIRKDNWGGTY